MFSFLLHFVFMLFDWWRLWCNCSCVCFGPSGFRPCLFGGWRVLNTASSCLLGIGVVPLISLKTVVHFYFSWQSLFCVVLWHLVSLEYWMNSVLFDGFHTSGGVHVKTLINIWTVFNLEWILDNDIDT